MATKGIFLIKVKMKLEVWKADVEGLQENADRIGAQDMGRYSALIQEIIAKIQQIEKQFTNKERPSADTWLMLKYRVEEIGKDIEESIQRARKDFSL